jgi:hypothetical protein
MQQLTILFDLKQLRHDLVARFRGRLRWSFSGAPPFELEACRGILVEGSGAIISEIMNGRNRNGWPCWRWSVKFRGKEFSQTSV